MNICPKLTNCQLLLLRNNIEKLTQFKNYLKKYIVNITVCIGDMFFSLRVFKG